MDMSGRRLLLNQGLIFDVLHETLLLLVDIQEKKIVTLLVNIYIYMHIRIICIKKYNIH